VVDLGPDGLVVIAVVSTVNLALRTPAEQDGLVAGFARYLHALGGPVQILIRALPVDLHTHLYQLRSQAAHLPHPALAAAAHDHLTHLARLAQQDGDDELLTRQVLLVLREPSRPASAAAPDRRSAERARPWRREPGMNAGERRLLRRLHDAATLLAAVDVSVTVLNAAHTTAVLVATCNPNHPNTRANTRGGASDSIVRGRTRGIGNDDIPPITDRGSDQTPNDHTAYEGHDGYRWYDAAGRDHDHDEHGDHMSDDPDSDDDIGNVDNFDDFDDIDDVDDVGRGARDLHAISAGLEDLESGVASWAPGPPSQAVRYEPAGRGTR
jgi:hypothetical protein